MAPPRGLVTVDIDGTLTTEHGWRVIARRFGVEAEEEASSARFREGRTGESGRLREMLAIAEGHPLADLEAALAATPRLSGIAEGVARWRETGRHVALLTHNPGYVCAWYARTFGFETWAGTRVPEPGRDGLIPPAGPVRADKLAGLDQLLRRFGVARAETVHVGDDRSDALVFRAVGAGVAVNPRLEEVALAASATVRTTDFSDVVRAVEALPRR